MHLRRSDHRTTATARPIRSAQRGSRFGLEGRVRQVSRRSVDRAESAATSRRQTSACTRLLIAGAIALTLAGFATAPAFGSNGNGDPSPPVQDTQTSDTAQPSSDPSNDPADTAQPATAPAATDSNAPGNGNGNNGNGLGNGGGNGNSGNGGNSANAHAQAGQNQPSNASSIARVDQPGANGGVDQSNNVQAAADAAATNDAGPATASAGAVAAQDSPSNINLSARVNSPGDDGATSQTNSSGANANAAATGTQDSQAQADATAGQQSPLNVNVSVRLNSPGDQGSVRQSNTADATAAETPSPPADGPQSAGDSNSASIDNSAALGQSLEQCGSQCITGLNDPATPSATLAPNDQAPLVTPVQAATETSATAIQQAPTNVNVSVRLASPGSDGVVNQANTANATADETTVTSNGPTNVNLQVTVAGDNGNIAASSNGLPWTWSWNWDLGTAPTAADTATNEWNWDWTQPATNGTSAAEASDAPIATAPVPADGHWLWIFNYTAPDGTQVSVVSDQPCACAWVWSWSWSGAPAVNAPQAPTAASAEETPALPPQIVQSNDALAAANASASTDVEQQAGQNAPGSQTADQQTDLMQTADAESVVVQTGASNSSVISAGELSALEQSNLVSVSSTAAAAFTAKQTISQTLQLTAGDLASHQEGASQQVTIIQSASAAARAAQAGAHNRTRVAARGHSEAPIGAITQSNTARVSALASSSAAVVQQITQHQLGEGADQVARASQDATLIQDAQADSEVAQANLGNTVEVLIPAGGIFNPPINQANDVHASAQMANGALIEQDVTQSESGAFITWSATAEQNATVVQSGDAFASADQAGIENIAGWTGPTATPSSPPSSDRASLGGPAPDIRLISPSSFSPGAGRPVLPHGGTLTGETPAAPSRARGGPFLPAVPRSRSRTASSSLSSSSGRLSSTIAAASPRARAATDAGNCAPFCHGAVSGGLTGLVFGSSGGWFALEPRAFKLAAPGVGRLLDDAPALGRPVDIAPFERPG